jgi:hypothetical protein
VFFRNTVVEANADYTYDATYRLVAATGREHLGQLGDPVPPDPYDTGATGLDAPGDGQAMGRYQETYSYDAVGNIVSIRHTGSDAAHPGWTRTYTYGTGNRLDATVVGAGPAEPCTYDAHGSMTSMPHLPLMQWDHADRLRAAAQQVVNAGLPETTWYGYDSAGQRARWVTLRSAAPGTQPSRKCERIYLGAFEVYREYDGAGAVTLERLSLSVLDGTKRIALAERRTIGADGSPELLVRYQFGNHLGSATLELDADGRVISYEEYHPYGSTSYQAVDKALRAAAKRYRFTGMERDESTGLEPASGGLDTPVSATVGPEWTAADETIHVSLDGDAILIHLSRVYDKEINQAFRLENKNTPPRPGAHHDPPAVPYTTWTPFIEGTATVPFPNPLWVTHSEPQGAVTHHILEVGSDWTLRTLDNPVTGDGAQTAALADPFFYRDSEGTFYVEPAVTQTLLLDDGWVIPAVTAHRTFDTEPYWAGLNLLSQAPTAAISDVGFSPAARFTITARADWSTAATTTIDYQGTPITAPVTPTRTGAPR